MQVIKILHIENYLILVQKKIIEHTKKTGNTLQP